MKIIRSADRGQADLGWLKARYSFSFASYFNPNRMGYSALRVINEDQIAPGLGFGEHSHRDMEIITYVLSGQLKHRDSMGNSSIILPGEFQYMSAGSGVTHSEFNPDKQSITHLLQIWIVPNQLGAEPRYDQRAIDPKKKKNKWCLVAAPSEDGDAISVRQEAKLWVAELDAGKELEAPFQSGRKYYLHLIRGNLQIRNERFSTGDALEIDGNEPFQVVATEPSELLLFELP